MPSLATDHKAMQKPLILPAAMPSLATDRMTTQKSLAPLKSEEQIRQEILRLLQEMRVECGGGGNCQFNSIGTAVGAMGDTFEQKGKTIRQNLASVFENMPDNEFQELLKRYKYEQSKGGLEGTGIEKWITNVHDKPAFIKEILKPGFNYEGDEESLYLLSKALGIGIYIVDINRIQYGVFGFEKQLNEFIILLYTGNSQSGHYQALGVKDGNQTVYRFMKNQMHPKVSTLFALIREYEALYKSKKN